MHRAVINVPRGLFRAFEIDWDIDWRGQSVGQDNNGVTKTVYNAFPRWVGSPSIVLGSAFVAQWRAIRASSQGVVGVYRLPMVDPVADARLGASDAIRLNGVPFSAGQRFSTGKGFEYVPFIVNAALAKAGDVHLSLVLSDDGNLPVVGQFISHNDFPYLVTWVTPGGSGEFEVGIQMPLRRDIPSGAEIQLAAYGLFEAADEGMGNPAYGNDLVSRPRLAFREYLR